jgi:probable F420-dependent oxidoreductase
VKYWYTIAFAPMSHLAGITAVADEVGFEGLNLAHHLVTPAKITSPYPYTDDNHVWWDPAAPFPDPWVTAASLGVISPRLKFCTSIFILPMQDPITVAKAVSTAACLTGNRILLGVGAGWMKEEFDLTGQDFANRGPRMDEMLVVIEKLCSGTMVEHHGDFYDVPACQMSPAPTERVPVLIGGHSAPALRRAATADGWFSAGPYTEAEAATHLTALREARREAGTLDQPYECIVGLTSKPDRGEFERLEALGATAFTIVPSYYTGNPNPSLDDRRRDMEAFAEEFIKDGH